MTIFTIWWQGFPGAALLGGAIGLAWGLAADRLAARWPAHEDGSTRAIDWRTAIVAIVGAAALALTVAGFGGDLRQIALLGVVVLGLVVLFATDLDQRLLPDVLTLPLIPLALLAFATGISPFVHDGSELLWAAVAAIGIPLGLYLLSIPFGAGAIGEGDLKLLVGMGLLIGPSVLIVGLIVGALLAAIAIVILIAARRITLKSYVPYGPFLILGLLYTMLVSGAPAIP